MSSHLFRRVLHLGLALASLSIAITAVRLFNRPVDYKLEARYSQNLRLLEAMDAELNAQVLAIRSNLSYRYDSLAERTKALRELQISLREVPGFLGSAYALDLRRQLDEHAALSREKFDDIEKFKSCYASFRNSLHYFPTAARQWAERGDASDPKVAPVIQGAVSALLALELMPTRDSLAGFDRAERELIATIAHITDPTQVEHLNLLARHARVILALKPQVDQLVERIVTAKTTQVAARLSATYTGYYQAKLDSVRLQQDVLLCEIIVLVACALLEIIRRQQMHTLALARASRELETANVALSKERERERELNRLKSQFVSMTSHEFRTPLAGIISSSELLEKYATRWDGDKIRTHLTRIKSLARRMSHMLEEMLLIGRADARMLQASPAPVNFDQHCQQLMATIGGNYGPEKTVNYEFRGQTQVVVDEGLMTHIISNLLENAFKYSRDTGTVTFSVECNNVDCSIKVMDQGIGIPAEDLSQIFEGFHRASNVGRIPGTGLGLAVVKRSVEVQGGSISVTSEVGKGTTFLVQIPMLSSATNLPEVPRA